MPLWRFLDYITADGVNLIQDWYSAQDEDVQLQFDVTLDILRAEANWEDPEVGEFKPLTRAHVGLGEIVFHTIIEDATRGKVRKRRFRPVGIWPVARHGEFILILGCEKYGRTLIPHAAFDLALDYKSEFEAGRGTLSEHT
jgi:hypothetical protein